MEKIFKTPKAPKKYSQYGAKSKGAKLLWIDAEQLWKEHKEPWQCDNIAYSAITREKFIAMRKTHILYFVSKFTYTRQSDAHEVSMYFILRGPNGEISTSTMEYGLYFEKATSNWTWTCYDEIFWQQFVPDQKITEPFDYTGSYSPDPGTYTLEQYFNDELVNSCQFKIKK